MQSSLFDDGSPAHIPPKLTGGKVKPTLTPLPDGFEEPVSRPSAFPPFVRDGVASDLADVIADVAHGRASADELYRYLRGSLYLLTESELVNVAHAIIANLKGDSRDRTEGG